MCWNKCYRLPVFSRHEDTSRCWPAGSFSHGTPNPSARGYKRRGPLDSPEARHRRKHLKWFELACRRACGGSEGARAAAHSRRSALRAGCRPLLRLSIERKRPTRTRGQNRHSITKTAATATTPITAQSSAGAAEAAGASARAPPRPAGAGAPASAGSAGAGAENTAGAGSGAGARAVFGLP